MHQSIATSPQPSEADVRHTLTPIEMLDLFACALQYKVDSADPENAPVIRRSHEALSRTFENGKRQGFKEGYAAALAAARRDADDLFSRVKKEAA